MTTAVDQVEDYVEYYRACEPDPMDGFRLFRPRIWAENVIVTHADKQLFHREWRISVDLPTLCRCETCCDLPACCCELSPYRLVHLKPSASFGSFRRRSRLKLGGPRTTRGLSAAPAG